jgi:two-component system, cell cycle response regulator DivK
MKKRILLVDDNEATRELLKLELQHLGYEAVVAKNGFEAVELAGSERPDLIMMDMLMPQMDGFEAISRIKMNPEARAIPILASTAKAGPGDQARCIEAGCDGYLAKPYTHKELAARLEQLLDGNRASKKGRDQGVGD